MEQDKVLMAAAIGALSTLPGEITTRVLLSFHIGRYSAYELSSLIVTMNRPEIFMGIIISTIVGGTVGALVYYLVGKIGMRYLIVKSSILALLGWVHFEVIYKWIIEGPRLITPRPISDYYIQLLGSLVFGLAMGVLFEKYLFKQRVE